MKCPLCTGAARRQDENHGLVPGISFGFYAVLECGKCGLRLRRHAQPNGTTDVEDLWKQIGNQAFKRGLEAGRSSAF